MVASHEIRRFDLALPVNQKSPPAIDRKSSCKLGPSWRDRTAEIIAAIVQSKGKKIIKVNTIDWSGRKKGKAA
jgi:hypothetical protein